MSGCNTPSPMSSPRLPHESPGSSISSHMRDEYDELLRYSVVVPKYDIEKAPCVLENALGLFITPTLQLQLQKSNEHVQKFKSTQSSPIKQVSTNQETEGDMEPVFDSVYKAMNAQIMLHADSFTNTTLDSLSNENHNNAETTCTTTTESSPEMLHIRRSRKPHNNSNDINPRKHSPIPMSPPTNLDFESNCNTIDKSSLDTISNHNPSNQMDDKLLLKQQMMNQTNVKLFLDKMFKDFKGQILSEFEKSRLQLMQEQQKRLIDEKEKQSIEISNLQKEIETTKNSLVEYEKNLEKKDDVIANLSKALEKQREKSELHRVMMEWKLKKLETTREAFTSKLAEKFYQLKIKSKIFLNWHIIRSQKHKNKVEKSCKKKAEEVCLDLAKQYEEKIKKLEDELLVANDKLKKFKEEMMKYEDSMRKALMRGVCALNLEAMSIFDDENTNSSNNNNNNNSIKKPSFNSHGNKISGTYYSDDDLNGPKNGSVQTMINDKTIIVDESTPVEEIQEQQKASNKKVQFRPSAFKKVNETNDLDSIVNKVKEHCGLRYATNNQFKLTSNTAGIIQTNPTHNEDLSPDKNALNEYENMVKNQIRNSATKSKTPKTKSAASYPFRNIVIEKHTKTGADQQEINKITQPKLLVTSSSAQSIASKRVLK